MAETLPQPPSSESLPESLQKTIQLARRIAQTDLGEKIPGLRKSGEMRSQEVNDAYEVFELGKPPQNLHLLDYLNENLPVYLSSLPQDQLKPFFDAGVLKQEGDQIVFGDNIPPDKKVELIAALINHISQQKTLPDTGPLDANNFCTGLQALALECAQEAYNQYQPPTQTGEVTITERRITPIDRFKIRISYEGRDKKEVLLNEVLLNTEKGMIFKLRRDVKAVNNEGKEVDFYDFIIPIQDQIDSGNLEEAIKLANQTRDQFTEILEKNPQEKDRILFTLKRLINMRLTDSHIPADQKTAFQALLSANLEDPQQFQQALNLVFNFDELRQDSQSPDEKTKRQAEDRLRIKTFELAALVFGTEGLQRTVEVDLRMAVGLEDILLPPEARLQRIKLLEKTREQRRRMNEIKRSTEEPLEKRQLEALNAESKWQETLTQLRQLEQQQREAILYAFGVKDDEGKPLVDESQLTEEQKQLAKEIAQRRRTLIESGQDRVLSLNRTMVQEMLRLEGINLTSEQINALNDLVSGKSQKTVEETLADWGIKPEDERYQLIKTIIQDGRRVNSSLTGLARKVQDDFSRVEDLSLTGSVGGKKPKIDDVSHNVFLMGLKGVEYMYRHFRFKKEEQTQKVTIKEEKPPLDLPETVPTYQILQSEAISPAKPTEQPQPPAAEEEPTTAPEEAAPTESPPPAEQPAAEVESAPLTAEEEAAETETPEQRLERLTTFDPKVVESDRKKAEKLRQQIESEPQEEEKGRRVSLKKLKEQLMAAKQEKSALAHLDIDDLAYSASDDELETIAQERRDLDQIIEGLEKAIEAKKRLEAAKRAEKNLAALEEKGRLRELVSALKQDEQRQTAQQDLETIKPLIEGNPKILETAQTLLAQLHRRGIFRSDIAHFNRLAEDIARQLEQTSGWDHQAHQLNIESVKRTLLYAAITMSTQPQPTAEPEPPESKPPAATEEPQPPAQPEPTASQQSVEELINKGKEELKKRKEELEDIIPYPYQPTPISSSPATPAPTSVTTPPPASPQPTAQPQPPAAAEAEPTAAEEKPTEEEEEEEAETPLTLEPLNLDDKEQQQVRRFYYLRQLVLSLPHTQEYTALKSALTLELTELTKQSPKLFQTDEQERVIIKGRPIYDIAKQQVDQQRENITRAFASVDIQSLSDEAFQSCLSSISFLFPEAILKLSDDIEEMVTTFVQSDKFKEKLQTASDEEKFAFASAVLNFGDKEQKRQMILFLAEKKYKDLNPILTGDNKDIVEGLKKLINSLSPPTTQLPPFLQEQPSPLPAEKPTTAAETEAAAGTPATTEEPTTVAEAAPTEAEQTPTPQPTEEPQPTAPTTVATKEINILALMRRLNEDPLHRKEIFSTFTDEEKTAVAQEFLNRAGGSLSQVPEWAKSFLTVSAPIDTETKSPPPARQSAPEKVKAILAKLQRPFKKRPRKPNLPPPTRVGRLDE
ncbi:MAG: hypothetical protein QHH09_02625 [Microgenomates group bacterium]|nr:hypothetical protein [Microgenomates group bacterium]